MSRENEQFHISPTNFVPSWKKLSQRLESTDFGVGVVAVLVDPNISTYTTLLPALSSLEALLITFTS
jgi:hypothetical protein